ncbi:uncharacterized protein ACMZJ9_016824 [Mantella aurantiaca]
MLQQSLHLFFLALIGICSADDIPVMSGVFMPINISVDYGGAQAACAMHHSRLATMDEITTAFKNGYEYCKWGWTHKNRLVMLRLTPFLPCGGYSVGILIRDCPNINSVFCANGSDSVSVTIVPIKNRIASYENASKACVDNDARVATKKDIDDNIRNVTINTLAWYNYGVGQVQNEKLVLDDCFDSSSQASAFCYNPTLADVIINKDDRTLKKIIMACLLALVFVVLLLAAAIMRGNKAICCMGQRKTQPPDSPQVPVPTWNKTSIYRRISQTNKGVLYDNFANVEKRQPAIRPDMSTYKTHYSNMAFDNTGEQ